MMNRSSLLFAFIFSSICVVVVMSQSSSVYYDPTTRDFTSVCDSFAQLGRDYCTMFMKCCSTEGKLDQYNGDRCLHADANNHCKWDKVKDSVSTIRCLAYNCTAEITTTTTTPRSSRVGAAHSTMHTGLAGALLLITTTTTVLLLSWESIGGQ